MILIMAGTPGGVTFISSALAEPPVISAQTLHWIIWRCAAATSGSSCDNYWAPFSDSRWLSLRL